MANERVESRIELVGRGSGTTPARIEQLRIRQKEAEKLNRVDPDKPFASFLNSDSTVEELSEKERKHAALPKQGPRPGLVHPGLRDVFGRDDDNSGPVVLKG